MDDNVVELALALATAIKARLPQLELGGLAIDLEQTLGGSSPRLRSDEWMARVSVCPFARIPIEAWLRQCAPIRMEALPADRGEPDAPEIASTICDIPVARRVRAQTRPLGRRALASRAAAVTPSRPRG